MVTKYLTAEIAESAGMTSDYTTTKGDVTVTDGTKTVTISRDDFAAICKKLFKSSNLSFYSRMHRGAELPSSDRMLTITSINDNGKPRLAYIIAGNDDAAHIYMKGAGQKPTGLSRKRVTAPFFIAYFALSFTLSITPPLQLLLLPTT